MIQTYCIDDFLLTLKQRNMIFAMKTDIANSGNGVDLFPGCFQDGPVWWLTKDGDTACLALYNRHYSKYHYRDGRTPKLFCGPGEKLVLRTWEGDACFVWRKFKDDSGQEGVNCAVFRNESTRLSSELIRQADAIADCCWPGERHYTYVNSERIKSNNPGYCFKIAGWRECGKTKHKGLIILERT